MARSCVGLLLLCADYMANNLDEEENQKEEEEDDDEEGEEDDGERVKSKLEVKLKKQKGKAGKKKRKEGIFSRSLKDGLTSQNWSIRFKTSKSVGLLIFFSNYCEMKHHQAKLGLGSYCIPRACIHEY